MTTMNQEICMWPELDNGKRILTGPFLACCDVIVDIFGALGTLMTPVKNDVSGNVNKLRKLYVINQEKYQYLEDLISIERKIPKSSAVDALLWLKRALHLMFAIMDSLMKDAEQNKEDLDISSNYLSAYNRTLRPYHNFAIQKIFTLCINRGKMPNRRELLLTMPTSKNASPEISIKELVGRLKPFLHGFQANLTAVISFYHAEGLDSVTSID